MGRRESDTTEQLNNNKIIYLPILVENSNLTLRDVVGNCMIRILSAFFTLIYLEIYVCRENILIVAFLYTFMCCVFSHSVVSESLQPHRLQPARLLCPWGFSRQEGWSGLPCPPSEDLPNLGTKPSSPALQADSLPTDPPGKPKNTGVFIISQILCLCIYMYTFIHLYVYIHNICM